MTQTNTLFWLMPLLLIIILMIWSIIIYNRQIRLKNLTLEGWSGIDVQLKRRYDLIPNLVEVVKGYAIHEKDLLERITRNRSAINSYAHSSQKQAMQQRIETEMTLSDQLGKLFAVVENYPDLKANTNFRDLHHTLTEVEDTLQMARRYYNGTVRDYNIALQSFPDMLIAKLFKFQPQIFFALDSRVEAQNIQVKI